MKKNIFLLLSGFLVFTLLQCSSANFASPDPALPDGDEIRSAPEQVLLHLQVQHHDRYGQAIDLAKKISVTKNLFWPDLPLKIADPWQGPPGYYRKEIETNLGYQVHLEIGEINWSRLRLVSDVQTKDCPQNAEHEFFIDKTENLMAPDAVINEVTSALVAAAAYCDYEVSAAPVGAFNVKLHAGHGDTTNPGENALKPGSDFSLHLEGSWFYGKDSGAIKIRNNEMLKVRKPIFAKGDDKNKEMPLFLSEKNSFCWTTEYDLLFENIDFKKLSEEEVERKILDNFKTSIRSCF